MSNIVITHFSAIFHNNSYQSPCFYDGLISSLIEYGHNVMQVITSDFSVFVWNSDNKVISKSIKKDVIRGIKEFNPDLVLSFNNCSIEGIEDELNCPIALLDADSWHFFNSKENIKKKLDRYHFISFTEYGVEDYFRNLPSMKRNQVIMMPPATAVKSESLKKIHNISFIASPFYNHPSTLDLLQDNKWIIDATKDEILDRGHLLEPILKDYNLNMSDVLYYRSGANRMRIVLAMLDLGIAVFGPRSWKNMSAFDVGIIKSYNSATVFSLEHNQNIYNSSIISLNVKHAQTVSGYPWRVPDILASSSVLLTDHSKDLVNQVGSEVNLQIYQSSNDAVEIANKLLQDEVLRKEIVMQQNEVVEKKYRWHHRFPLIQQLTGVSLEKCSEKKGTKQRLRVNYGFLQSMEVFYYLYISWRRRSLKKDIKKYNNKLPPALQYHIMRALHRSYSDA